MKRILLLTGLALHALAGITQADVHGWTPSARELDAAINTGDFSGYLSGASDWLSQKVPVDTNRNFKKAHKNKELVASFDGLNAWEYSKVVSSHASDADLTWGREMINTFRPDLLTGEMVVNITSQVWRRNSPVPYTNMSTVLQGGGKCGPRSSFAVFICQAFGIPAIGVAQPAHACVVSLP